MRLSKTPSFVNLLELKLTQARTSPDQTHNAAPACNTSRAKKDDFETEKLKASNFPALLLRIGSWEVRKSETIFLGKEKVRYPDIRTCKFDEFYEFFCREYLGTKATWLRNVTMPRKKLCGKYWMGL